MVTTAAISAILSVLAAGGDAPAPAGRVVVDRVDALEAAIAKAKAGSVILLADGTYRTTGPVRLKAKVALPARPIVIRAEHRGKAVLEGVAGLDLVDCAHVTIEGLRFAHDADRAAILMTNCRRCRVTRNHFALAEKNPPRRWEHWVYAVGARSGQNRFDHNLFERKRHRGSPLFVRGDDAARVCSRQDRIDHNHFRDIPHADGENGHETLRTGSNILGEQDRDSLTVIEDNLFERCSGESEIISLKSSANTVRRNTFVNCRGAVHCRLGHRNTIADNVFLCDDAGDRRGGVSLYGRGHRVIGNTFRGLTGHSMDAPLALKPGTFDGRIAPPRATHGGDRTCAAAVENTVSRNVWVDCNALEFGLANQARFRPLAPHDNTFRDNLVVGGMRGKALVRLHVPGAATFEGNVAWSTDPRRLVGVWARHFRLVDPAKLPTSAPSLPSWPPRPKRLTPSDVGPDAREKRDPRGSGK